MNRLQSLFLRSYGPYWSDNWGSMIAKDFYSVALFFILFLFENVFFFLYVIEVKGPLLLQPFLVCYDRIFFYLPKPMLLRIFITYILVFLAISIILHCTALKKNYKIFIATTIAIIKYVCIISVWSWQYVADARHAGWRNNKRHRHFLQQEGLMGH